jgi:RHS repeat-associated protein
MTFDGFNTLTYDVENRLVEAQNEAWGTSTYRYDPLGHRKQKQVASGAWVTTTQFVLAGNEEIADYNGVGGPLSLTVRGAGGLPVAAVTPAVDGATLAAVYYHHDAMGSTVAVTTPGNSGAAEAYTYSDYGAPGAGSWATYRFGGYRYDSETGLYYVNARYYNPNLGRFLQTDPIGTAGGANLYAYVGNDPINLFDPTGMSAEETGNDSGSMLSSDYDPGNANSNTEIAAGPGANYAIAEAFGAADDNSSDCFAQLKYRHVPDTISNHAFWWVQDSTGTQWVMDAGPVGNVTATTGVDATPDFGYLNDWVTEGSVGHYAADNSGATTSFSTGPPSSATCTSVNNMLRAAWNWNRNINNTIPYDPTGPNSNSYARYIGQAGGYNPAEPPYATGWGTNIPGTP